MDLTNPVTIAIVVVILLIVGGLLAVAFRRAQQSKRLKEQFGPEYERAVSEMGDRRQAESELEERIEHVKTLNIRPLTAEEVNRYALEWQKTQREFVDEPLGALQKADRLIREVMKAKGYPVEDFEQRTADISVDYPDLVADYRGMHSIAIKERSDNVDTEEMRQAMVHARALFEHLIGQDSNEELNRKEKT